MAICPKCNAEIKDGSNFCNKCGSKLSHVKKCPNCGFETGENENKFCPKCGSELEDSLSAEEPKKNEVQKVETTTNKKSNVLRGIKIAVIVSCLVAIAFLFIGYLTPIIHQDASNAYQFKSFTYYFHEGIKELDQISRTPALKGKPYHVIVAIRYALDLTSFVVGLTFSLVFGIKGIINAVRALSNKEEFNIKFFVYALIAAIPYLAINATALVSEGRTSGTKVFCELSVGGVLIILAGILIIASLVLEKIKECKNVKNYVVSGLFGAAMFLSLMLILNGNSMIIYIKNGSNYLSLSNYYSLVSVALAGVLGNWELVAKRFTQILIGGIFILTSVVLQFFAFHNLLKKKTNTIAAIALTSISFVSTIIGTSLTVAGFKTEETTVIWNPLVIFGLLLALNIIGLLIAIKIIDKDYIVAKEGLN